MIGPGRGDWFFDDFSKPLRTLVDLCAFLVGLGRFLVGVGPGRSLQCITSRSNGEKLFGTLPDAFHFGQCCPFGQFLSSGRFEYDFRPCSRKELF
jgi:hypothetical protein